MTHWVIHSPKLCIASRALSSPPIFPHVNHNIVLFIAFRALSVQPGVLHIIHSPNLFIALRATGSWPRIVHIIHNPKLLIAFIISSIQYVTICISALTMRNSLQWSRQVIPIIRRKWTKASCVLPKSMTLL